jgi:membrane protein YqaA with SNARE-associated domain
MAVFTDPWCTMRRLSKSPISATFPRPMDTLSTFFGDPGLPQLFLLSFLAATLLPVGSEWLLVVMLLQGNSPSAVVLTATVGNFLGACTTYLIGIWGAPLVIRRVLRIDAEQLVRANRLYNRYGIWTLLLSWLPVIGDPLCLLAGLMKVSPTRFTVLVLTGKFCRYAGLALIVLKTSSP